MSMIFLWIYTNLLHIFFKPNRQTINVQRAEEIIECHHDDHLDGNPIDLRKPPWLQRGSAEDKSLNGEFWGSIKWGASDRLKSVHIIIVNNKSFQRYETVAMMMRDRIKTRRRLSSYEIFMSFFHFFASREQQDFFHALVDVVSRSKKRCWNAEILLKVP